MANLRRADACCGDTCDPPRRLALSASCPVRPHRTLAGSHRGPLARLTLLHPAALGRLARRRACRAEFSSRTRSRARPALSATAPPSWSRGQARQCRAQILQARRYGPEPVGHAAQTHSVGFGSPTAISRVGPHPGHRVIAMVHPLPTARITQHLVAGAGVRVSHDPQTFRTVEPHDQPLYLLIWRGAFHDRAPASSGRVSGQFQARNKRVKITSTRPQHRESTVLNLLPQLAGCVVICSPGCGHGHASGTSARGWARGATRCGIVDWDFLHPAPRVGRSSRRGRGERGSWSSSG